jgi:CRP-like cAMP-binding protein
MKENKKAQEETMTDVSFLLTYPIYRDFEPQDVDVLSQICEEKKYKDKEVIFQAGAPGDGMYIIKSGTVKIWVETDKRKKMVALLSDGEFFGEMAMIDNSPRSATVTAEGDTEAVKLSLDGFNRLKAEYSSTGFKVVGVLLKFMAHRIRRTTKKAAELIKGRKKKTKKKK